MREIVPVITIDAVAEIIAAAGMMRRCRPAGRRVRV
jgi:hypothetical protein